MKSNKFNESGQAIIMIAVSLIVLLGFVALAIDGGMVYSDRRHAQNAADAASLAGGGAAALTLENQHVFYSTWNCNDPKILLAEQNAVASAISRAGSNRYTIDADPADGNGATAVCGEEDNGSWIDKFIDVSTYISATTPTYFAQVLFKGVLNNRVSAVTRIRPRTAMAFGDAIVSLSSDCPNINQGGVSFEGGGGQVHNVHILGGGVFSNSCLTGNGGVIAEVDPEKGFHHYGEYNPPPGSGSLSPEPEPATIQIPDYPVQTPQCDQVPMRSAPPRHGDISIAPGRYPEILRNNGKLELQPGLYCVDGDFNVNGDWVEGHDVTIYLINGSFSTTAGSEVHLSAPLATCRAPVCPYAIPGLLFYMRKGNTGTVALQGNSTSYFQGTIYVPTGTIDAGGGSSELPTLRTQLIGWTVKVHGNVNIDIIFDGGENYQRPAYLELYR
ncbi:MAG: Tad domain-containing protein [Omnitrophica WOR_2 bacterium]